ncbi:hypothetical protein [Cellulomonas sp. URHD0024]|uniref:hypothetical protein n=1 Tax=Cellulomonas sp. URHD0024 TaxID=1302620 RepID=UPI0003F92F4A|nr:hypothetical protein [Cellulomonas sp. URHD0024]
MSVTTATRSVGRSVRRSVAVSAAFAVLSVPVLAQPASAVDAAPTTISIPGSEAVVVGTPAVGQVLTAGLDWPEGLTLTYEWDADGVPVEDETDADLDVVPALIGATLTVTVTGNGTGYDERVSTSEPTEVVVPGTLQATAPGITGTARVGSTLTASAGAWTPADAATSLQWYVGADPVADATGSTFVPRAADVGAVVTVRVQGTRDGYNLLETSSLPTAAVARGAFISAPAPTVSGTPRVGSELTAVTGTWLPAATFTYAWKSGTTVVGTASTFTPTSAELAKTITVSVTGARDGYTSATRTATANAAVASGRFTTVPVPTLTGTPRVGVRLTAVPGTWAPTATLAYQWYRAGVAITGATSSTYVLTASDLSKVVTVTVKGTRSGFTARSATSAGVTVAAGHLSTAPVPTITGTVRVGQKLTAVPGTWAPAGTTISYRWYRNGVAISGATLSTYTLVAADLGTKITVVTTGRKTGYTSLARTSAATATVVSNFASAPVPTVTGTLRVGYTLGITLGTWTPAPAFSYQWQANGSAISGATSSTYKLTAKDYGKTISVSVVGSKTNYVTTTRLSASTAKVAAPVPALTTDGLFAVGSQIKPGTYVSSGGSICYWERDSATDILGRDAGYGQRMVTILSTDTYFYTDGCGRWTKYVGIGSLSSSSPVDGVFVVGVHLKPGVYTTTGPADPAHTCLWIKLSSFNFGPQDPVIYGEPSGTSTITLADGQRFYTQNCSWKRIG